MKSKKELLQICEHIAGIFVEQELTANDGVYVSTQLYLATIANKFPNMPDESRKIYASLFIEGIYDIIIQNKKK